MIAFSIGVIAGSFAPAFPPVNLPLFFISLLALAFTTSEFPLVKAYLLGVCWVLLSLQHLSERIIPHELENQDLWVTGQVIGLPQQTERSTRFILRVEELCSIPLLKACEEHYLKPRPENLLLNDYGQLNVKPGDTWRLKVRIKRPHGFSNPGSFDYEAWLWEQGFSATGYVRNDQDNQKIETERFGVSSFHWLRFNIRERFENLFSVNRDNKQNYNLNHKEIILALTLGDRTQISHQQWDVFSHTGTNHLMVISGLHVGLVSMLVFTLSKYLWSRSIGLMQRMPAQRAAAMFALLAAFLYAAVAGFSLPAQRAFIMIATSLFALLVCRPVNVQNSLCLALGLILLLNPLSVVSAGFWLSFGAVALLLHFALEPEKTDKALLFELGQEQRSRSPLISFLKAHIRAQWVLFIGLFPLMLTIFQHYSLLAPIINLIAIPLVGMIIVPLCLLAMIFLYLSPTISEITLIGADILLSGFIFWLEQLSGSISFANIQLPALSIFGKALVICSALLLLMQVKKRFKLASALGILPFILQTSDLQEGEFKLHVLDVGQGLAIVIETQNHSFIYDAGPQYSSRFEAAGGIILPFYRANNLPVPELIFISHGDNDHSGGLNTLQSIFPDSRYLSGEPERLPQQTEITLCRSSQHWKYDDVTFEVIYPIALQEFKNSNNASCVMKVSSGGQSVLLTGDIESKVERQLLSTNRHQLLSTVLIAPHHGSKSSSSNLFLNAVQPEYAVFSSGYLNRFNHPHPNILSRYQNKGIKTLQTPGSGTVSFHFSGVNSPNIEEYRHTRQRIWSKQ